MNTKILIKDSSKIFIANLRKHSKQIKGCIAESGVECVLAGARCFEVIVMFEAFFIFEVLLILNSSLFLKTSSFFRSYSQRGSLLYTRHNLSLPLTFIRFAPSPGCRPRFGLHKCQLSSVPPIPVTVSDTRRNKLGLSCAKLSSAEAS